VQTDYDILIIGGGHAGAEAAWAAANLLAGAAGASPPGRTEGGRPGGLAPAASGAAGRVGLITMDPTKTGAMSCNPAIGGLAKGQIVREIDALGGLMGLAADATGIQFRVLNQSKGPAVQGPRCQSDKYAYAAEVQRLLGTRENLDVVAGTVEDFLVQDGRCVGVVMKGAERQRGKGGSAERGGDCCGDFGPCENDRPTRQADAADTQPLGPSTPQPLTAKAVVLTTGTFMRALMHAGPRKTPGGRIGEGSADGISGALKRLGFDLGRLKTGTPPRLAAESLDFSGLEVQPGDETPRPFSDMTLTGTQKPGDGHPRALPLYAKVAERFPLLEQQVCWITHTHAAAHDLIRANLDHAPMYNGQIAPGNVGPRYCPSIEDKVVRFADRTSHHVFLEPESLTTNEIYCNGISTSLPPEVQLRVVQMLPGCENAVMLKPGYAVEYDMVWPHQIDATCMTKRLPGLFLAGQINGTSGYEEAAGQGLIAGVNAVRWCRAVRAAGGEAPHTDAGLQVGGILDRFEPFRLTREQAYLGVLMDDLVTKTPREPYRMFTSRAEHRLMLRADNADQRLTPMGRELGTVDDMRWSVFEANRARRAELGRALDAASVEGQPMGKWAHRPDVSVEDVAERLGAWVATPADRAALRAVLAERQYAGYIERSRRELDRLAEREHATLPADLDFRAVPGLRSEAAAVLDKFRPATLGQAGRLAGVNPADLMVVSVAVGRG
jgi:tRNA uridine 5-carboxymethylaminomethyl modification enzyme